MLFEPAIVAALVTLIIGGAITALRYIFNVRLITRPEVDKRIEAADEELRDEFDSISSKLDEHSEQLENIETLIMGSEYQVSDGMLEIIETNRETVEDQEERIDGVERIQLKIRRRQQQHNGGEAVAHGEDLDPPPSMDTDLHQDADGDN